MTKFCVKLLIVVVATTSGVVKPYLVNAPFARRISSLTTTTSAALRFKTTSLLSTSSEEPKLSSDNGSNSTVGIQDKSRHVSILDMSLKKLTGRGVYDRMNIPQGALQEVLSNNRFVLISHGTQKDPIYNFGNTACLEAFVRTWQELCRIPSRESVVTRSQDDALRIELMNNVTNNGFVEGATGIRVTGDGRLIRLVDAVVSPEWDCHHTFKDVDGSFSIHFSLDSLSVCLLLHRYGIAMMRMEITMDRQRFLIGRS